MYTYKKIKIMNDLKKNITKIVKSNFINVDEYLQDINICFENKNFDSKNNIISFNYEFKNNETMSGKIEFLKIYFRVRSSPEIIYEIERSLKAKKKSEALHLYEFYKSCIYKS